MQLVLTGSLGVLVLGSLALAQSPPPSQPRTDPFTIERTFAEGGRVRLQLASSEYVVRAGASDRIVVRWEPEDGARLKDIRALSVDVQVTGSTALVTTGGKASDMDFVIELPARSDVHLRMRAGEVWLQDIEGHKDVRMTAGEMTIGVRRASLASAHASVTIGDLDARALGISKSGLKRSLDWFGSGPYQLDARLGAGEITLEEETPTARSSSLHPRPVPVPTFDAEPGLRWSSSREEYDAARADARFALEQFTYVSDGLTVGAYLYRPRMRGASRLPVIVHNRGSYTRPAGFAGEMLVMANRYAQAGFIVIAPHYRGSNGWQGRDEMGGADLADLMNIVPQVARVDGADPSRVYLSGESRGGMMVYQALRDRFPAKAAAVWGAFTDLEPLVAPGSPQAKGAPQIWPDLELNRDAIVERRSAIRWADRIHTPMLIMHGTADQDMPIEHSQRMAAELRRLGRTHRLPLFDGERHRIGGRGADRDAAAIEWFRRFNGG
jgi:poly(3-hydroxybutyrate) depolymerase